MPSFEKVEPANSLDVKFGVTFFAKSAMRPSGNPENISYHAVEKEGSVTAIWEMHGQKHLRTIDPRSNEGKQILALFETAA